MGKAMIPGIAAGIQLPTLPKRRSLASSFLKLRAFIPYGSMSTYMHIFTERWVGKKTRMAKEKDGTASRDLQVQVS
jgi:hypothetical protein